MIYLDNNATTPMDPRVRAVMVEQYSREATGNPHSEHVAGRRAEQVVERARAQVAALIGAQAEEIIFTAGATEANNLVIQGRIRAQASTGGHLIVSAIEHKCVLDTARYFADQDVQVDVVPVDQAGRVDVGTVEALLRDRTLLVSIMMANNEIGVVQPIAALAEVCAAHAIPFHTDAAQAAGKIPVDVTELGVDFMSLSAHKLYGPIGIGALYMSQASGVPLEPLIIGGGQERGYRSGTLSPALCAGFGEACAIAQAEREADAQATQALRERFLAILRSYDIGFTVHAEASPRLPGLLSVALTGIDADALVGALQPYVALSTTAACSAGTLQPSHVLQALALPTEVAASTVRIGFGRFNDRAQVEDAAKRVAEAARRQLNARN